VNVAALRRRHNIILRATVDDASRPGFWVTVVANPSCRGNAAAQPLVTTTPEAPSAPRAAPPTTMTTWRPSFLRHGR